MIGPIHTTTSPPTMEPPRRPQAKSSVAVRREQLRRLLERANLLEYYPAFIHQGGDDVRQICEANDDEINEILQIVGMDVKPLHTLRFVKAVSEWKKVLGDGECRRHETVRGRSRVDIAVQTSPPPSIASAIAVGATYDWDDEHKAIIREHSAIYGRKSKNCKKRKTLDLTNHELSVNSAAYELCIRDPTLLVRRNELLNRSRAIVRGSGYAFVHGRSRAKQALSAKTKTKEQEKKNDVMVARGRDEDETANKRSRTDTSSSSPSPTSSSLSSDSEDGTLQVERYPIATEMRLLDSN